MGQSATPRPAATVILVRPSDLAVFLVKRHGRSGFMAGAHVFPGGRVDDEDRGYPDLQSAADALVDEAAPEVRLGACVAAVRETLEECAVLLCRGADRETADAVFRAVHEGGDFHEEVRKRELVPDLTSLHPWSWWITPEAEPKRYDTRFFLAEAPAHDARADLKETTEGDWFQPAEALAAYERGDIVLAPPTLATLEDLAPFGSLEEAARAVQRPLPPICPQLTSDETGGMVLALPGDALHPVRERAMAARTRIVMSDSGRFTSS